MKLWWLADHFVHSALWDLLALELDFVVLGEYLEGFEFVCLADCGEGLFVVGVGFVCWC